MSQLPIATLATQQIEPVRLPVSSYRQRGQNFGRFQPFDLLGDHDDRGNNQLNWICLFLINKLGNPCLEKSDISCTDKIFELETVDEETRREIKRLGRLLSREFDRIKEDIANLSSYSDLAAIKEEIKKIRGFEGIDNRITKLEKRVGQIYDLIKIVEEKSQEYY